MLVVLLSLSLSAARLGDAGDSCTATADCGDGLTCHNQECVFKACSRTADCPGAMRCSQKRCVAPPPPAAAPAEPPAPAYDVAPTTYHASGPRPPFRYDQKPQRLRVGDEIPPGAHVERRNIKPLWVAGLTIDLGVWAIRGTITAAQCASYSPGSHGCGAGSIAALVPVIGAWIQLTDAGDTGQQAALVVSGIVELGGFVMLVVGAAVHHDYLVWDNGGMSLRVVPTAAPGSTGLALAGHF